MNNDITKARAIAKIAHAGQKYGDGSDYFERHILDVVKGVVKAGGPHKTIAIAYLHDTVEDTAVTLDDLADMGFDAVIIAAVDALTRRDGENYLSDYIPRVNKNLLASFVKKCDLAANTNDATPPGLAKRNKKAAEALA